MSKTAHIGTISTSEAELLNTGSRFLNWQIWTLIIQPLSRYYNLLSLLYVTFHVDGWEQQLVKDTRLSETVKSSIKDV